MKADYPKDESLALKLSKAIQRAQLMSVAFIIIENKALKIADILAEALTESPMEENKDKFANKLWRTVCLAVNIEKFGRATICNSIQFLKESEKLGDEVKNGFFNQWLKKECHDYISKNEKYFILTPLNFLSLIKQSQEILDDISSLSSLVKNKEKYKNFAKSLDMAVNETQSLKDQLTEYFFEYSMIENFGDKK